MARIPIPRVSQRGVPNIRGISAGLSCTQPCSPVLDDCNGRPAIRVSVNLSLTETGSYRFGTLPRLATVPPGRPYKANVGGSRPSAPTKPFQHIPRTHLSDDDPRGEFAEQQLLLGGVQWIRIARGMAFLRENGRCAPV